MARTVRSLSPRPRPRHGIGHSSDRSMGLDPEPKLSVSASNGVRTQSAPRVSTAHRSHRPPHTRSRLQPLLPVRPRSPTPRVGRHSGRRKPGHQRHRSAQCAAQPGAVARGDHKTPSREARGSCRAARASGRVPGEHCLPSDTPGPSSLAPRSPSHPAFGTPPRPPPIGIPRLRSLEPPNFPSLIPCPLSPHPAFSTFFPSPSHLPPNSVTASPSTLHLCPNF